MGLAFLAKVKVVDALTGRFSQCGQIHQSPPKMLKRPGLGKEVGVRKSSIYVFREGPVTSRPQILGH